MVYLFIWNIVGAMYQEHSMCTVHVVHLLTASQQRLLIGPKMRFSTVIHDV